jgi:protein TorT
MDVPVTSKIFVDHPMKGFQTGEYLVKKMGEAGGNVVAFPGPQGSGWAENYLKGFTKALKDSKVKILDTKFGDAGVPEQLRLVEDALQTYPDMNAIWGTAPTAEGAINAIKDAGREDVIIVASYENQAMLKAMMSGAILGFDTEYPVMQGKIAVDLAVKALEKMPFQPYYLVAPRMITSDMVKDIDVTQILAPDGWQPVFSVE